MEDYPAKLEIDYPEKLNRWKTFFRVFLAFPVLFLFVLLAGGFDYYDYGDKVKYLSTAGLLYAATLLMLLFRHKYPRWWFDWNFNLTKFGIRVFAYCCLLRDEYPSTDEDQAVHAELKYPDAKQELSRWLPLVKWFLALPHYFLLAILFLGIFFAVFIAWWAILFTGRYPRPLFNYITGTFRWAFRVDAYAFILTTDKYPPFGFK
ncbi:MAG: DUF4389 domain-containing protein [Ignavibacteriaceae bacterium]|nr:DUF4389 domain-containing protein [Ignavibacteriaceae bacterium]